MIHNNDYYRLVEFTKVQHHIDLPWKKFHPNHVSLI